MEERRKHSRTEIDEPAYVSSGGSVELQGEISRPRAPPSMSRTPAFVPQYFRLVMASDSSVHEFRITWIQQKRIGVTFAAMPKGPDKG
jgi:hypothetical protein